MPATPRPPIRAGKAEKGAQAQSVDAHRKVLLRRQLLRHALPGPVYVPFIGDGDMAIECYGGRKVFGADIDADRVLTAQRRLAASGQLGAVTTADCDTWPDLHPRARWAIADFDAYAYPYDSFRAWWEHGGPKADRLVLIFTDGQRQNLCRQVNWHHPDGRRLEHPGLAVSRPIYNFYAPKTVLPWLADAVKPYRVVRKSFYTRGISMLYLGAVVER